MATTRVLARLATRQTGMLPSLNGTYCPPEFLLTVLPRSRTARHMPFLSRFRLCDRHQGTGAHLQGGRKDSTQPCYQARIGEQDVDNRGHRARQGCKDQVFSHLQVES